MPVHEEHLAIGVDGASLAATVVTPGVLNPGVLFVHGWGGSQEQYRARAKELASYGCVCLTFDLRGHVATQSYFTTVSREQNLADLEAAYDLLVSRPHVDRNAIAVVGSSYGGYLATILSTLRPVRWLALRAPALYRDEGWGHAKLQLHADQDLAGYRSTLVPADRNRALAACGRFRGDLLLVSSEFDERVPQTVIRSYQDAANDCRSLTVRCIGGADHGLTRPGDQRAYTNILRAWFKEMLSGARVRTLVTPQDDANAPPERPPTAQSIATATPDRPV
jgi:uncharacterized protein